MECIAGSGQSVSECKYTEKQKKLLEAFDSIISQEGIELLIDPYRHSLGFEGPVACDVEHDEQGNLVGIGLCKEKLCIYLTEIDNTLVSEMLTMSFIMHNGVSDIECLRMWGINVKDDQLVHDTMLVGHLLDSSLKDYGLKGMSKRELGIVYPSYDDIVGKRGLKAERITLDKQPLELVAKYCSLDAYCTYKIYEKQRKQIES